MLRGGGGREALRLLLMTTWCSTQTYRSHGENKSSGRRRRRRSRRCGGGVRRAVCEHHPPRQERSRFTQMLSSPHFIHHVRTVKAKAALSPLLTACVMMMSRGSPKKTNASSSKGGRACEISLGCTYALRKTEAYARAGRGPVSRDDRKRVFSRPLATFFPHFGCQQYLNTSSRYPY